MSATTGNDPAWRPDEDGPTIKAEELWLQGAFVACVAYGAVAILSVQCFFMLVQGVKRRKLLRDAHLVLFVVLIFCLNTTYIGLLIQLTQQAFVDDRNYPGGPGEYEVDESIIPINVAGNTALIVITMLADALLVSRSPLASLMSYSQPPPALEMYCHLQKQHHDSLVVRRPRCRILAH